jgi:hypothetical protein
MKPLHTIVLGLVAGAVLWTSVGCALLATPQTGPKNYPYQGPLVDTNGIPINPPRW